MQGDTAFSNSLPVPCETEAHGVHQTIIDAENLLDGNLLSLQRKVENIQGKYQPAVFQIFDIVLDGIDASKSKLILQLIERNRK
jgi:hypothetical protein